MLRSPRPLTLRPVFLRPVSRSLALLGFMCLVLLGCGSNGQAGTVAGTGDQAGVAAPTAVPTTAPLLLPPADVSLPALAALPADVAVPDVAVPLPTSDAPAESTSPVEAAPAAPVESAPVPAEPAVSQAAPTQPATQLDAALTLTSASRWSDCVVAAAQSSDALAVLDPIAAGTTTDMTSVQLNTLAAASVSCDLVTSNLGSTDLVDYVATSSSCLNAWLESSGGGSVFVGLSSISWGQPTPAWAQSHLIDALDACFTGTSFAADVMASVGADASLSAAFDAGCLATSFDTSGTMRTFAQALATDPTNAALYVGLDDAWVLACANVGHMVAAAASADGVALSASTISCIDAELTSTGLVAGLISGTADTDAVGIATITCLTDDETVALLG